MNEKSNKNVGDRGEDFAVDLLSKKKYEIIERNYRFGHGEIDIIAKKKPFIIFIEVKTRRTNYFGEPFTFVDKRKQNFIINAANEYILKNNIHEEARFDIVSILYNDRKKDINHIKDAFYPRL